MLLTCLRNLQLSGRLHTISVSVFEKCEKKKRELFAEKAEDAIWRSGRGDRTDDDLRGSRTAPKLCYRLFPLCSI